MTGATYAPKTTAKRTLLSVCVVAIQGMTRVVNTAVPTVSVDVTLWLASDQILTTVLPALSAYSRATCAEPETAAEAGIRQIATCVAVVATLVGPVCRTPLKYQLRRSTVPPVITVPKWMRFAV